MNVAVVAAFLHRAQERGKPVTGSPRGKSGRPPADVFFLTTSGSSECPPSCTLHSTTHVPGSRKVEGAKGSVHGKIPVGSISRGCYTRFPDFSHKSAKTRNLESKYY